MLLAPNGQPSNLTPEQYKLVRTKAFKDWFGDWDGLHPGHVDKFITEDLSSGRMVEVIDSGEPAIMVCHWPGIYYNGEKVGFNIFKDIVKRLNEKYDHLVWMKLSEISRYWAAKELSTITTEKNKITVKAPYSTSGFTLRLNTRISKPTTRSP